MKKIKNSIFLLMVLESIVQSIYIDIYITISLEEEWLREIQYLIDQIQKEGVEKAELEAEKIINEAKSEAEKIINEAKSEAEKVNQKAIDES